MFLEERQLFIKFDKNKNITAAHDWKLRRFGNSVTSA